ncbi:putative protein N(5)-glutamine methyltransferase [Kineosporia mesophila]|uniref:peptide chain release factor N(5)-glutamine methyltransferase n=1 Tax=Kineosporia mesophila TaxID=566012 RepID=A0ABP6ZBY7_9ACTN|nr:putative protein N(5)-glutamine methyltransferase [Kineosporia mesophila]MCD5350178.1 putative protein N(5)-glutamine methyltransferase [Kineosporia mesophila]
MTYDEVVTALRAAGCVWAEEEASLLMNSTDAPANLGTRVARRVQGEPLELIVGWAEFRGLRIKVAPGVFIPRRRTEFLAEKAISAVRAVENAVVVELCCGAGAISAAILEEARPAELHAADIDHIAIELARTNLATPETGTGPDPQVHQGDMYLALPGRLAGRVDVLVANVPYVPTADIAFLPAEARDHEPLRTLDGGVDGLALYRRLMQDAAHWLSPGGKIMSETSLQQLTPAQDLSFEHGFISTVHQDNNLGANVVISSHRR